MDIRVNAVVPGEAPLLHVRHAVAKDAVLGRRRVGEIQNDLGSQI